MQAAVQQCNATVDFLEDKLKPYPATVNDEAMYKHAKSVGESLLGEPNVYLLDYGCRGLQLLLTEDASCIFHDWGK